MNPTFIDDMSWRMAEVYGAVTDRILINLAHHFQYIKAGNAPSGSWDYQVRKLAEMGQVTKETEQIILQMLGGADSALQTLLEESIREALKDVEKPLRTAAEKGLLNGAGMLPPEVDPHQMQAFKAFYEQSADKLNLVNTVMLESTQAAYTATVADIANRMNAVQGILNTETGGVVTGVTTLNQAIRSGVQRMVKTGITGYIDHGGHRWSPEAYVAMDVRTTMANASREAVFERNEQYGNDLYQVSHHNGARPLCYPWQGKVISRDDLSREVEDDEGNKVHVYAQSETTYGQAAGLFGVNCKHYPIPFVPGFSRIRPPEQDKKANDKEYAESQQQRALERNYRYEKRDLAVLKAQGAPEEEIKAQRERVKTARNNLDDFCEETGRARRTGREGTPIDARWPVGGGEVRRFGGEYVRTDQPLPPVSRVRTQTTTQEQQTGQTGQSGQFGRDMFAQAKGLTDSFKTGMADTLLASGNDDAIKLYGKFADQLNCVNPNHKKGAHYSPWQKGVSMNLSEVAKGNSYETPYQVAFHEFGHMIDDISRPNTFEYLSSSERNGKRLLDVIKEDFKGFKKSMGATTNDELITMLKSENMDAKACGDISDILEKCTNKSYPLGIGHGVGYHRRDGATEKEFFAEVLDSAVANKESYAQMVRLFPNAVNFVWDLIKEVTK